MTLTSKLIIFILANNVQADVSDHDIHDGNRPGKVSTSDIYGRGVKRHICLVQTKVMTNMELELMIRMYQLQSSSMWLVVGMPKGQS